MSRRPPMLAIVGMVLGALALATPVCLGAYVLIGSLRTLDGMVARPAAIPDDDERDELITTGRTAAIPAYWLGRRYRGLDLNALEVRADGVTLGTASSSATRAAGTRSR